MSPDDYSNKLKEEYQYFAHRFQLSYPSVLQWKFGRIRPHNQPTVRIAQLAALLNGWHDFTGLLIDSKNPQEIIKVLKTPVSPYWQEHYHFGKRRKKTNGCLGDDSIDVILINTVIPFVFFYGQKHDNQWLKNKAIDWLDSIEAEKNSTIAGWEKLGAEIKSARQSQAYIQLKNEYCNKSRCLDCQLGSLIVREGLPYR